MYWRRFFLITAMLCALAPAFAAKVEMHDVPSKTMERTLPAIFILPDAYQQGQTRYPVVYLLHGFAGDCNNWLNNVASLREIADSHSLIIACPEGLDSWYFDSPVDATSQFETYISAEVVQFTDETYRTIATPNARAITGFSMGGHGALFLAFRHTDVYGAAGSMSGGVDLRPFPNEWNIKLKIGAIEEQPARWAEMSVVNNVNRIKDGELALIIDCGTQDFFLAVNRNLHEALLENGIGHDYTERPGWHNWAYWRNAVKYQMLFFQDFFIKHAEKAGE